MGNSPLVSYTRISPNKTSPRNHEIDTITIHCAVGQVSVETLGNIFAPVARQASSNYGVGADGRIGMYCEEKDRSWCSSSGANDHRAITIEVACDTTYPYAVKDNVYEALIQLVADICQRNNIKELKWKADKSLIGQPELQNMTAHRWFAATACLPTDTEILTKKGWVTIKEIKIGEDIATVIPNSNWQVEFSPVLDKIEPYLSDVWLCQDFMATPNHRVFYYKKNSSKNILTTEYFDLLNATSHSIRLPYCGYINNKGLDISDNLLRFLIAVQADGHYMTEYRSTIPYQYGVEFHLKKERKINRIIEILDNLDFPYSINKKSDGSASVRIYNNDTTNYVQLCEKWLINKTFGWDWINLSPEQAKILFSELLLWDGCVANNTYTSTIKQNIDIVSAIAALNGQPSHVDTSHQKISFKPNNYYGIDKYKKQSQLQQIEVGCVQVTSGAFICRQNGRTFITGNCPGDYLYERFGDIAMRVNAIIAPAQTEESDEEMTQEKFNEMMNNYLIQLAEQKETWGSDNLQWAINNGIIIGDETGRAMPNKFLTRLEGVTMLRRFYELITKK